MKYLMKLTVIITFLLGGLFMSSCDKEEISSGFYSPGFYEVQYTVKDRKLKIDVKKECTDPKMLLVVSVDEVSDTISSNVFVKAYSLKKGKHTIEIEAGRIVDNGSFKLDVNSKFSQEINCK